MKRLSSFVLSLVLLFSTSLSICSYGQGLAWAQVFGIGQGNATSVGCVGLDGANNVYTVGGFNGTIDLDRSSTTYSLTALGNWNMFLLKEDGVGNFIWAKAFLGISAGVYGLGAKAIAFDANGNIYISGTIRDSFDMDPGPQTFNLSTDGALSTYILKLTPTGDFVWAKEIGGVGMNGGLASVMGMRVNSQGAVYIAWQLAGTVDADPSLNVFNLTSAGVSDIVVEKLDTAGNFHWAKRIGGADDDDVWALTIDTASNLYLCGDFKMTTDFDPSPAVVNLTSSGNYDVFVAKLDSAGDYQWAKAIGGVGDDIANAIEADTFGNIMMTGYFNNTVDFDPGPGTDNHVANSRDIFTLKLRNNGDFAWAKTISSTPGIDEGRVIATDGQGSIYTGGFLLNSADVNPGSGVFTLGGPFAQKLDSLGNFVWAVNLGGLPGWIGLDGAGSVYATGATGINVDFDPGPGSYVLSGYSYIEKFCVSQPLTLLTDKTAMCSGDTAHLTTASQPGATYYWLNGGTVIPGSNNDTLNATATGSYSVYVYGNGCPSGSDTVSLTVTPSVHPSITINAPASATIGQQVTVTAMLTNAGTGYSINWYNKGIYQGTTATPSFSYTKQPGNDTITAEIVNSANPCYYPDTSNMKVVTVIDGIADVMKSLGLSIYPNPFTDIITIKGLKEKDIITITDISGRIIEAHAATGDVLTIKTDSLSAGYYILKIADEKGVKVNVPVVK